MKETVLIVEDQFVEADYLERMLKKAGYSVAGIARNVQIAREMIKKQMPGFVLLDIFLSGKETGIDLARELTALNIPFIYLSANSNEEVLNDAKRTCPYGFLVKPFREKDLIITMEIARYRHEFNTEQRNKKTHAATQAKHHGGIIGTSSVMKEVMELVSQVAPSNTSVLILGESGTGKELIADCIHLQSSRSQWPIIKVNCASLPLQLAESELFGHEKGSFTGAIERHIGKFEKANKGTIFLDEIGEMTLDLQVKLLRVLQERYIERVGSKEPTPVDVRIIAATNRNLEKEVAEGRFRLDLYYRLNVFPIQLPALRSRPGDITELAEHFLIKHRQSNQKNITGFSDNAMRSLKQYHWPGNIRELENLVERSVLLAKGPVIETIPMPAEQLGTKKDDAGTKSIDENERDHIINVLKKCRGKVWGENGAASLLNINASTLKSKMKKLGINKNEFS